jgi:FAD/FMN-containing dehydrogenase
VQGGNTGLVGGSVPDGSGRAVVLSTRRLGELGEVDRSAGQVTLGAGVALAVARDHVRSSGFDVPVDLAARDTATVGGMTATNAGGTHVLRHGTMRRNLAGVEAVLGDGRVISHLAGLEKDNTGYDLGGLLCGSEGTLGVVTRVRLRLVALLPHRVAALLALPDLGAAVATVASLRATMGALEAAEYVVRAGLELVMERFGLADPFPQPYPTYLLVEAAGARDPTEDLTSAIDATGLVLDAAVASSALRREELWRLRDLHTEAVAAVGPPRKYDVTVPLRDVAAFVDAATAVVAATSGTLSVHHWGHLGDGNIHLNVLGPAPHLGGVASGDLDGAVLGLVARFGGSISAEHGIGRLKRPWLHLSRSASEVSAFRAVKRALDPAGILNPGVLLPDP